MKGRLPIGLWPALLLVTVAPRVAGAAADFDPRSESWNGLSGFAAAVGRAPATVLHTVPAVDWARLGSRDALLIVHPTEPVDVAAARRFVQGGGRLVLADDFGRGEGLLREFGLSRVPAPGRRGEALGGNPVLAVARAAAGHPLMEGVGRLVCNHPAGLEAQGRIVATFAGTGVHLAVERVLGEGRFLALSDPSVLIDNMRELPGNRRFADNLVRWACRGRPRCRLSLHVGGLAAVAGDDELSLPAGEAPAAASWTADLSGLDRELLWLVSVVTCGLALLLLVGLVPAGAETAWAGGSPPSVAPRPVPMALQLSALSALPDHGDGRLVAALVERRSRAVLRRRGPVEEPHVTFARLAMRPDRIPGGVAGLAGLIQDLGDAPDRADPYDPAVRDWSMAQALALYDRVRAVEGRHDS